MRWRMVDRVDTFEPWTSISGIKAISFEEGMLLGWSGRQGEYPFTLLVECCVELANWLAELSSGFSQMCLLEGIEDFRLERVPEVGNRLQISVQVLNRREGALSVQCRIDEGNSILASGALKLVTLPMKDYRDPDSAAALWQEVHGAA